MLANKIIPQIPLENFCGSMYGTQIVLKAYLITCILINKYPVNKYTVHYLYNSWYLFIFMGAEILGYEPEKVQWTMIYSMCFQFDNVP